MFRTSIIMEHRLPFITKVYNIYQDLYIAVNIYTSKKAYAITTKRSKKNKKGELQKIWMQCDKGGIFMAKEFGKRETTTRKDECSFTIIATQDNKIGSWSLAIADATHNHPPTHLGAHPIHWQLARIDKVKELIVSQTRIGASSKQVIAAIQIDTDEENPLVKPKDVYNERAAQRRKQLGLFTPV